MKQTGFCAGISRVGTHHRGGAVAIGNFDGVHLGHQAVIAALAEQAEARALKPRLAMIFEPQPSEYFHPSTCPGRLTALRDKVRLLSELPLDALLCLRFGASLASLSAEEFVRRILRDALDVRLVVVGGDFRFGRGRSGDFSLLSTLGRELGYDTVAAPTCEMEGERVSSTRIRGCLACGDLAGAARLLGRHYAITGRVVPGLKLGRVLGFPTANIALRRPASPLSGIFVVEVHGEAGFEQIGVASLGTRPTLKVTTPGGTTPLLEVHLFDYAGNLYGRCLEVRFLHKLRDEAKFDSIASLKAHIAADCEAARAWLHGHAPRHVQ